MLTCVLIFGFPRCLATVVLQRVLHDHVPVSERTFLALFHVVCWRRPLGPQCCIMDLLIFGTWDAECSNEQKPWDTEVSFLLSREHVRLEHSSLSPFCQFRLFGCCFSLHADISVGVESALTAWLHMAEEISHCISVCSAPPSLIDVEVSLPVICTDTRLDLSTVCAPSLPLPPSLPPPRPPPYSSNSMRGNVWLWFIGWFHSSLIFCQWGVHRKGWNVAFLVWAFVNMGFFDGDEASKRPVWTCRLRSSDVTLRGTTVLNTGAFVPGEHAYYLSKTHTRRSGYSSQTSMTLPPPVPASAFIFLLLTVCESVLVMVCRLACIW